MPTLLGALGVLNPRLSRNLLESLMGAVVALGESSGLVPGHLGFRA